MSQEQQKEVNEINQLLAQAKNTLHATCGSASGLISDTVTSLFVQLGQKMLSLQIQNSQLKKENEDLKKKIPKEKIKNN